jgi:Transposase DDE domain
MTTSKSPRRVFQVAYDAACQALPAHRHRFSPKKFTQPQLLACLVLKEFLRLDYRGFAEHLTDHLDLARLIELKVVPHYTTFQKAAVRLLKAAPARALFDAVLVRAVRDKVRKRRVPLAAVDGTGMESRHVSRYYVKRRSKTGTGTQETTYAKYPKVVLVTDCHSHMVLAAEPGRGPASDLVLFKAALKQAANRARIGTLLADADFDGEWVHEHVRTYGIRTLIPPERGRPSEKPPVGKWRRRMKQRFNKKKYGQRWQTETVNSMIKRRLGSALRARSYWSQCREIMLRVITHNVMIVARIRVFYRARQGHFGSRRDPRTRRAKLRGSAEDVRSLDGPILALGGSDSPADGPGDDQLCRRPVRGCGSAGRDQRQPRFGAVVSLAQES